MADGAMNDGMLVSRRWLEKVDAHVNKTKAEPKQARGTASLFYDIRPARLQTAWTQNAAGLWRATARFIVNDAVDNSFTFPVYAPTATSSPGGTAGTTRFFVIWRGRWEMVAGEGGVTYTAGTGIAISSNVIGNTGVLKVQLETGDNGSGTATVYLNPTYFKWAQGSSDLIHTDKTNADCVLAVKYPDWSISATVSNNVLTLNVGQSNTYS